MAAYSPSDSGTVITLQVDMLDRVAKMFVSDESNPGALKEITGTHSWERLPEKVYIAAAAKGANRDIVFLPYSHHKLTCS